MIPIADQVVTSASRVRQIATELEAIEPVGKIDWQKIISLLLEILPIILQFFAEDIEKHKA